MTFSINNDFKSVWPFLLLFSTLFFVLAANTYRAEYRWYDETTLKRGAKLFQENCVACHQANTEGTADWKVRDANGNLTPPPLNGTAHSWHHSKATLVSQILQGGSQYGGTMPGFGHKLTATDAEATIAFYQQWAQRNE